MHKITEFKELTGKTISKVTVTNELDFRSLTVQCTDETELNLRFTPHVSIEPEFLDWKSGDSRVLKKYPTVHERDEEGW